MKSIREVTLDIETTNFSGDFGHILCAVAKPIGEKPVVFRLDDYPNWKDQLNDDSLLVGDLIKYLNQTIRVITWYGAKFDIPFTYTRRKLANLDRSDEFLHLDAWKTSRKYFKFHNNRLDTYMVNLNTKADKTRVLPKEWIAAAYGSKEDMDYVVEHCIADVEGLEEVYLELEKETFYKGWNPARI